MSQWPANIGKDSSNKFTSVAGGECQAASLEQASSSKIPHSIDLACRTKEYLLREGGVRTVQKVWQFVGRFLGRRNNSAGVLRAHIAPAIDGEVLNLQPGELVEVKSAEEIAATLDERHTLRGLTFLPAMNEFCGKRFFVLKRLEKMYQEESGALRRVKNTVLLDRVMCDGLLMRCDRSCHFYWREAWLRRVTDIHGNR